MRQILILFVVFCTLIPSQVNSQIIPTVEEVHSFFSNSNILITYREGGPIYGTFYFIEIHYCPNGYGLYGRTSKQTVMGNYQTSNWQEFGTWEVTQQNGLTGIYYAPTGGQHLFVPIYKMSNGTLIINEATTIVHQGQAICN